MLSYCFSILLLFSGGILILVRPMIKSEDMTVLKLFYTYTHLWGFWVVAVVLAVTSFFLKINWYNKLKNEGIQSKVESADCKVRWDAE